MEKICKKCNKTYEDDILYCPFFICVWCPILTFPFMYNWQFSIITSSSTVKVEPLSMKIELFDKQNALPTLRFPVPRTLTQLWCNLYFHLFSTQKHRTLSIIFITITFLLNQNYAVKKKNGSWNKYISSNNNKDSKNVIHIQKKKKMKERTPYHRYFSHRTKATN